MKIPLQLASWMASFWPSMNLPYNSTLDKDLVLYFTIDEMDSEILFDHSGNNNSGYIQGGQFATSPGGNLLTLDGIDDYIFIEESNTLNLNDEFSIVLTFYTDDDCNVSGQLQKEILYRQGANLMIGLERDYENICWFRAFIKYNQKEEESYPTQEVEFRYDHSSSKKNNLYHIVFIFKKDSHLRLYRNGVLMDEEAPRYRAGVLISTDQENNYSIGARIKSDASIDRTFKTSLVNIRMYARALESAEVQTLYRLET
jgi:hypothetical protein